TVRRKAMPLWSMVVWCCVGAEPTGVKAALPLEKDFFVRLPASVRPVPEPLPAGQAEPSFKIRGTKGWLWRPEQYLAEVPTLAEYQMNFLMNCYGSMCDIEHYKWTDPECNRWWEPLPAEKKRAYERVVRACQKHGIHFCFSMNPNLFAKRFVRADDAKALDELWQHYEWMQGLGVTWFNICLDDIQKGIDAEDQGKVVNEILRRLRVKDPQVQMVFCPTRYWGMGDKPSDKAYLTKLAEVLDKDAYVFWTGPRVVTPTISRGEAEAYKACVGHRLFIWDNYPVNDAHPTLHLGPVTGRDPELCRVVDGYMANPLCSQNEINRLPLITMADYAYNSGGYDPQRSIGQAILHLGQTAEQRGVLKDLVELYPGMLVYSKGTSFNPVLARFDQIMGQPHCRFLACLYVDHVAEVSRRLGVAFPDRFCAARRTVEEDVGKMRGRVGRGK
ncbi:MAG: beta-N-acetylglucosaminidase domain-containing protein, partial [Phycisphaerae bacterium]|nr:beta-N-acetylglucosaminidase domain-containing protein [Phycisphaerae bacterium]